MKIKILLIIKLIVFIISSIFTYITFVEEQMGLPIMLLSVSAATLIFIITDINNIMVDIKNKKHIQHLLETDPDSLIKEFLDFSKKEARDFNTCEDYLYYSSNLLKEKGIFATENNLIYKTLNQRINYCIINNLCNYYNIPSLDEYILKEYIEEFLYKDLCKEEIKEVMKLYRQMEEYKTINDAEKIKIIKNKIHSMVA